MPQPRVCPVVRGHWHATGCGIHFRPSAVEGTAVFGEVTTTSGHPGRAEAQAVAFKGNAAEYFGIWIANLVLSIATLGVFSCWAKVRRVRYFRANTIILGDRLDYHATGLMILKGRLIVLGILAAILALGAYSPTAQFAVTASLLPLFPWLINRGIRFDARMTSWRNVRLDWSGTYWQAVRVLAVWPLTSLLSLGLLQPLASRAWRHFLANNVRLGRSRLRAGTPVRPYYCALVKTILYASASLAALAALMTLAASALMHWERDPEASASSALTVGPDIATVGTVVLFGWTALVTAYYRILARNIILGALTLDGGTRFASKAGALRYQWILVSNFLVTAATFAMMFPWARIRSYRYLSETVSVSPGAGLDRLTGRVGDRPGAFDEEFSEFQGIDISV